MSWTLLTGLALVLGIALLAAVVRRLELRRMSRNVKERERAIRQGSREAQLMHPVIDRSRCRGWRCTGRHSQC